MLTPDVRFEGWTHETWTRFLALWKPAALPEREASRPRGGLFVIHDGKQIRKLLHTQKGRLSPDVPWPVPLQQLAARHNAGWAFAAQRFALEEVMERLGARLRRTDDFTTQVLTLLSIVQQMTAEGLLERWPRRLQGVPPPTPAMIVRALDSVCADGHAIVLGLFQDGALHTAAVARRKGTGFDVLAGPEELRRPMGLLSGDWRRDCMYLARAVEELYAPLSLGCFAELDTFRRLQREAKPGEWSRAVAVRDVSVSPMPAAIALALGVDGARYAAGRIGRIPQIRRLAPLFSFMRDRIADVAPDRDVVQILGFDPLAALRSLLQR